MLTREELQRSWTQLKGRIRERWGQIKDDELVQAQGDGEQLIGFLQQKTGESRQAVEQFVRTALEQGEGILDRGQRYVQQAAEGARDYAHHAGESLSDGYRSVEQEIEGGYAEAQQVVRARPLESVTTAFGAGLVAGVVVSLVLRSHRT